MSGFYAVYDEIVKLSSKLDKLELERVNTYKDYIKALDALRVETGLYYADIGKGVGVSRQHIFNVLKYGKNSNKIKDIEKFLLKSKKSS